MVFVEIDAYQAAGGVMRVDLFSDDGGGFVTDAALLNELATAKLGTIADSYRAAGWKWVETRPRCDYSDLAAFRKTPRGYRRGTDSLGHAGEGDSSGESGNRSRPRQR